MNLHHIGHLARRTDDAGCFIQILMSQIVREPPCPDDLLVFLEPFRSCLEFEAQSPTEEATSQPPAVKARAQCKVRQARLTLLVAPLFRAPVVQLQRTGIRKWQRGTA
jgi:hypothetical protein